jgi:hypothetical protein
VTIQRVPLPSVLTPDSLAMHMPASEEASERILLDLSNARYLDVAALMILLGVAAKRQASGLLTLLHVPRQRNVRDFMRLWNFPNAFQTVTGASFRQLVPEDDLRFFGEAQETYRHARSGRRGVDPALDALIGSRFFEFITNRFSGAGAAPELVEREWRRWRDPLVMEVLRTHLAGPGQDVARVLVYEVLANVVQHPLATCVSTTSYVSGSYFDDRRHDTQLTICVWDDGQTIHETLRAAALKSGTIRASTPAIPDRIALKPVGWQISSPHISVDWTPGVDAADAEFVLASLFPGITQKVAFKRPTVKRFEAVPWESEIGFGLHALYRSVIDSFGGSIAIRSGSVFMNIKANPDRRERPEVPYRAKVVVGASPTIKGNMITIRIPLKEARDQADG